MYYTELSNPQFLYLKNQKTINKNNCTASLKGHSKSAFNQKISRDSVNFGSAEAAALTKSSIANAFQSGEAGQIREKIRQFLYFYRFPGFPGEMRYTCKEAKEIFDLMLTESFKLGNEEILINVFDTLMTFSSSNQEPWLPEDDFPAFVTKKMNLEPNPIRTKRPLHTKAELSKYISEMMDYGLKNNKYIFLQNLCMLSFRLTPEIQNTILTICLEKGKSSNNDKFVSNLLNSYSLLQVVNPEKKAEEINFWTSTAIKKNMPQTLYICATFQNLIDNKTVKTKNFENIFKFAIENMDYNLLGLSIKNLGELNIIKGSKSLDKFLASINEKIQTIEQADICLSNFNLLNKNEVHARKSNEIIKLFEDSSNVIVDNVKLENREGRGLYGSYFGLDTYYKIKLESTFKAMGTLLDLTGDTNYIDNKFDRLFSILRNNLIVEKTDMNNPLFLDTFDRGILEDMFIHTIPLLSPEHGQKRGKEILEILTKVAGMNEMQLKELFVKAWISQAKLVLK